ncbi:MAG TPA: vWA domain-containing protein, partial [Gemmataceae bacterium]|nr:vWA domain-containing protein [Gemmataceae bacterium]
MDSLIKLLSVDAPPGTRLRSAELQFRGLIPIWLAIVLLALLGILVVYLYLRERARLSTTARSVLALLRIGVFGILLFLLSRPLLLAEFAGERARSVVLLLDKSQSMTLQDRRLTPTDQMRVALAFGKVPPTAAITDSVPADVPKDPSRLTLVFEALKNPQMNLIPGLKKVGPIRTVLFGSDIREEEPAKILESGYKATDDKTALADAIIALLGKKDAETPAALVIATDGRDNASKYTLDEAAAEAKRLGVPIHVYGVGSTEAGSLQLRDVLAPDTLFAEDTVNIPIRWRSTGLKKGTLDIVLSLGGKEVGRKEIPVKPGEDLRDTLAFVVPKGKEAEEA